MRRAFTKVQKILANTEMLPVARNTQDMGAQTLQRFLRESKYC